MIKLLDFLVDWVVVRVVVRDGLAISSSRWSGLSCDCSLRRTVEVRIIGTALILRLD